MKKFYLLFSFTLLVLAQGFAQSCTPNTATGNPGVTPATASLPCAERGVPYTATIFVENFNNYSLSVGTIHVDSLRVDTIKNLPNGLSFVMNPASKVLHGGQTGCLNIYGRTYDSVGQYPAYIYATVWATLTPIVGNPSHLGPYSGRADSLIAQISQLTGQNIPVNFNYWVRVKQLCDTGCFALDTTGATNRIAAASAPAIPDLFIPRISGPSGACSGDSVWVKASYCGTPAGAVTYAWSNGATTDSVKVAAPSTVTAVLHGASGYVDSISYTVQGLALPSAHDTITHTDSISFSFQNTSSGSSKSYVVDSASGVIVDSTSSTTLQTFTATVNGTYYYYTVASNGCGNDTAQKQVVHITGIHHTGLANINNINAYVNIFPNPSTGQVNLQINSTVSNTENYTVRIYNIQGQEVFTQAFTGNVNKAIDLSNLGAGVYLVHVNSTNLSTVKKLIIK